MMLNGFFYLELRKVKEGIEEEKWSNLINVHTDKGDYNVFDMKQI